MTQTIYTIVTTDYYEHNMGTIKKQLLVPLQMKTKQKPISLETSSLN